MQSRRGEVEESIRSPAGTTILALDGFHSEVIEQTYRLPRAEHVQLAPGLFRGRLMSAQLGVSRVSWGSYSMPLLARGEMPGDKVTLGFVFEGEEPCLLNGQELSTPQPVLLTEGAEFHYRLPRGWQGLSFELPREEAERAGLELPEEGVARPAAEPQRSRSAERELASIVERLRDVALGSPEIHDPAAYLRQIESQLLDFFSATLTNAPISRLARATGPVRRMQLVRRATDIMSARLGEPLRVGAICRDIGCDWKTLERAFVTFNGVSPKQFLTMARLSTARRKLLGAPPDATVTSVALSCGMHHLGRFSSDYRRVFGEFPSETLARANR